MATGVNDVADAGPLGLGWILPLQELPKPEYSVERGSQFVAHPGQKFTLGVVGAVRLCLGLAEFFYF